MWRKVLILACLVVAAVLAVPVINLVAGPPSHTALSAAAPADPAASAVAPVLEAKCAHCHVPGTPAPFYARLPPASGLIARDVADGLRAIDLLAELGGGVRATEPALAKIEREVLSGEMPPAVYLVAHWTSGVSAAERDQIEAWIQQERTRRHDWPGLKPEQRAAAIPPLPATLEVPAAKAELGRKLYHDKRLSGDDTVSCASCHDLAKGGTDQLQVSTGVRGQKGGINAPTTFNAAFQLAQFWDGRAPTLEAQAAGPPNNPVEMDSNWPQIIGKLEADEAFGAEFKAVYPDGFSEATITDAIAAFERTLITPGSRFDKFVAGDAQALSAEERRGHQVFQQAGCATCHTGVLLGGGSYELMGRSEDYFATRGRTLTDADQGRFNVTKDDKDRHRFKVPTLRNIALTPPYFHDGSVEQLQEAVTTMARHQTGEALSAADAAAVTAFLQTLTGTFQGTAL